MMNKKEDFDKLLDDVSKCQCCKNLAVYGKDKSLYNVFKDRDKDFVIPSIWTDWKNRLDAKVMVIGQDWGPYKEMLDLYFEYAKDMSKEKYQELMDSEKSRTKKNLVEFMVTSSKGKISNLDDIYITNAILCGRMGDSYRGDDIDLKKSTMYCSKFLERQIDIVKSKVIVTLGFYPLMALANIWDFEIGKNLKETILNYPIIEVNGYVIIPMYHPVAQVRKEEQLSRYELIWKYI